MALCERCGDKFIRKKKKGTRRNNSKICGNCKKEALKKRVWKKRIKSQGGECN